MEIHIHPCDNTTDHEEKSMKSSLSCYIYMRDHIQIKFVFTRELCCFKGNDKYKEKTCYVSIQGFIQLHVFQPVM